MTDTPDRIDVSVLIPVLNEEAHLRTAAAAMLAQDFPGEVEFVFIDGGSKDSSVAILEELAERDPRIRVLANPHRRTPHALNIGLRAARGEFIARMDAHTLYPDRYLAAGVARLRRGGADWVSGPQLAVGTDPGSARVAQALSTALGKGGARFRDALTAEHEVDSGFTGVWRRDTLQRHRGWDEEWLNDQDTELAGRIRKEGGRIVCIPEMAAQYVPRSTLRALARQYRTYGTYRVKTAHRHPETLRRSQLLPPLVTVSAVAAAVAPWRRVRRPAQAAILAYVAALVAAAARGREGAPPAELAWLPVVWMTMHFSYGAGFLAACARSGVPLAAIGQVSGAPGWLGSRRVDGPSR